MFGNMSTETSQGTSSNNIELVIHEEQRQQQEPEILLPGFRFHPTEEELVGYYLRRKVMQSPLSVEVITQLDIYKFDPWDLPKMAVAKGEKEWYFFCPRDRKYRNSARPNRVTGSGFWKATGTDRPIYSGNAGKCIGLKKSLVFYKGRAAKGIKTDWMMHEFRLPASTDRSGPLGNIKIHPEETSLQQDAWAICRIFKKSTLAQRHAPMSDHWEIAQHDKLMADSSAAIRSFQQFQAEASDLDLDVRSQERSESTSEELELKGCCTGASTMQSDQTQHKFADSHIQQQLKKEQSTATWAVDMPYHNVGTMGPLLADSARSNAVHHKSNIISNNEARPVDMVNTLFAQESLSVKGALDFVNSMLNSPRSAAHFMNFKSNGVNHNSIMQQQGNYRGQDVYPVTVGPKMTTPMIEKFRRELTLQIPQGPMLQPFCAMQPWEMLSPIFDLSTPSTQLECM